MKTREDACGALLLAYLTLTKLHFQGDLLQDLSHEAVRTGAGRTYVVLLDLRVPQTVRNRHQPTGELHIAASDKLSRSVGRSIHATWRPELLRARGSPRRGDTWREGVGQFCGR